MPRKEEYIFSKNSGPYEILPEQVETWDAVVDDIRVSLANTGYQKMVSPLVEKESIFSKTLLEYLHIYDKKTLFTVKKKDQESMVVTAPGPISLIRTAVEQRLFKEDVTVKLYQYGMALVDEDNNESTEPRQMHVFKIESIGDATPVRDAETILTGYRILEDLGVTDLVVKVNCLGTSESRAAYYSELCSRSGKRFTNLCERYHHNPIALYGELVQQSTEVNIAFPIMLDHLSDKDSTHFQAVLEFLDTLDIPYEVDEQLDGAVGFNESTYFEIVSQEHPEIVLARGGRHDSILRELSVDSLSAETGSVGMEMYVDTILAKIWKEKRVRRVPTKPKIFVASIGQEGQKTALKILSLIQKKGLDVQESFGIKNLKQQLAHAKKINAPITLIIGRKEAIDGTVILRDQLSENQEIIPIDKLLQTIQSKLDESE